VGNGRFRLLAKLDPRFQLERMTLADPPFDERQRVRRHTGGTAKGDDDADNNAPQLERRTGPLPVNTLQVAGGELRFWGRTVRNENDRGIAGFTTMSNHIRIGFDNLDLNQIMQSFKPDGKPTPGVLNGDVVLYGTTRIEHRPSDRTRHRQAPATGPQTRPAEDTTLTRAIKSMQGEGTVELRSSDLANIKMIAALYNLLRTDVRTPTGHGRLNFRVENSSAYITAFRYFNRGVQVRAVGQVDELYLLRDATVRATAYGSIRTLKDIKLPIVRSIVPDLDEILSAIQQNGVSVQVGGTIYQPKVQPVLFQALGDQMRELLVGDYREANNLPAKK
jgi:hypothetical protein